MNNPGSNTEITDLNEIIEELKDNWVSEANWKEKEVHSIDYAVICGCAIKLLDDIFGEDNYSFPVDINRIYNQLGIPWYEMDLNSYMEGCGTKRVNRIIGKISIRKDMISNEVKRSVYVDENTPPILQRYAMAHELCHYIMNSNGTVFNDEYCNMPMLPKGPAELVADAFAIFLLIPLGPFLQEFYNYVKNERESGRPPFRTSQWIEHLSSVCFIAENYVSYGYQEIRYVASWLYSMKEKGEGPQNAANILWKKKDKYLKDEYIKELFR